MRAEERAKTRASRSLNPYYTGSYSMSKTDLDKLADAVVGLNPYYTGSYSMRIYSKYFSYRFT